MPAGRPTDYDPSYCDAIVECMGSGLSKTAFAGKIGVCRETILNWANKHEEFFHAVKRGEAARTACLEEGLLSEDVGPRVTARIFALKNACPDEWKERNEYRHTGELAFSGMSIVGPKDG